MGVGAVGAGTAFLDDGVEFADGVVNIGSRAAETVGS